MPRRSAPRAPSARRAAAALPAACALAACALAASLLAAPGAASAQVAVLPVPFRPFHDPFPVFAVHLDHASGMQALDGARFLGGRVSVEGERARVALVGGAVDSDAGGARPAVGVTASYSPCAAYRPANPVCGGTRIPQFEMLAGIGRSEIEGAAGRVARRWDVPVGAAVGVRGGPLPFSWLSALDLWAAARGHARHTALPAGGGAGGWRGGFGLSGGASVLTPFGVGIDAAAEWLRIRDPALPAWRSESAIQVGLFWRS